MTTTLPLHPRRAGVYFHTILGSVDNLTSRIQAFQNFYAASLNACKTATPCLQHDKELQIEASACISSSRLDLVIERDDDALVVPLKCVEFVVCFEVEHRLCCRIHYRDETDNTERCVTLHFGACDDDDEFRFVQWVLAVLCTATTLRQSKACKTTQLLWQAARLRILELTGILGHHSNVRLQNRVVDTISFLDAIQTTQSVLEEIADDDTSVALESCLFLRVKR
ncbi:hypothetical protein AC1031_015708 [Aphanomyces cochlioides]|nr:hypothetical protein AC1031_015708 [Aphanomyces cochlioides]